MEELRIVKHSDHGDAIMQQEVCFYKADYHQNKNQSILELKNAYDTVIMTLTTMKNSGFHLFRAHKGVSVEIKAAQASGSLTTDDHCYVWSQDANYCFYCTKQDQQLTFVMCDRNSRIGYMKEDCGYVKSLMYSAVFCAFWLWLRQRADIKAEIVYDETHYNQWMDQSI